MEPVDLDSLVEWQLWYQDTFDLECPRQVELAGRGLVAGLVELWARHLFETVQPDGQQGFSRFNLWLKGEGKSVEVLGDWNAQVRLRGWVFGDKRTSIKGYVQEGDRALLEKIAAAHKDCLQRGETSEPLLATVIASTSPDDFIQRLDFG